MPLSKPHLPASLIPEFMEEGETWLIQVGRGEYGEIETDPEIVALEAELAAICGDEPEHGSHGHTHYAPLDKIDETHAVLSRLLDVAERTGTRVHHEFPIV